MSARQPWTNCKIAEWFESREREMRKKERFSGLCSERAIHIPLKIILLATEMALNHSQFKVSSSEGGSLRKSIQLNNWSVWKPSMNMQEGNQSVSTSLLHRPPLGFNSTSGLQRKETPLVEHWRPLPQHEGYYWNKMGKKKSNQI